jgi:hypothetical protein
MKLFRIFILGMFEFRLGVTPNFGDDQDALEAYDAGRDLAHRLTLRRYDA